jgi:ATP synthase protein I
MTDPSKDSLRFAGQLALALELPLMLIGCVVVGGGVGWLLDRKLHTEPWLLLVGGLLGFVGGFLELLRRLNSDGGPSEPRSNSTNNTTAGSGGS